MKNGIFSLVGSDWAKAFVMAVFTGALLPISIATQTPGFSFATANWNQVLVVAINGAIVGAVAYLAKNFLSDKDGAVFGKIG